MVANESKRLAELYAAMNDGELENIAKNPNSLTDAAQVALGDTVAIQLHRGRLTTEVRKKEGKG